MHPLVAIVVEEFGQMAFAVFDVVLPLDAHHLDCSIELASCKKPLLCKQIYFENKIIKREHAPLYDTTSISTIICINSEQRKQVIC